MNTDHIVASEACTVFVGHDAVHLFRAAAVASSLTLYGRHKIIATRGVSPTKLLELATSYTKKKYKRGEHLKAADDVRKWADAMKAALPVVNK